MFAEFLAKNSMTPAAKAGLFQSLPTARLKAAPFQTNYQACVKPASTHLMASIQLNLAS
jgi:hypothetical protein